MSYVTRKPTSVANAAYIVRDQQALAWFSDTRRGVTHSEKVTVYDIADLPVQCLVNLKTEVSDVM